LLKIYHPALLVEATAGFIKAVIPSPIKFIICPKNRVLIEDRAAKQGIIYFFI